MAREVLKSKLFPGVEFELMDDFGEDDALLVAADESNVGNRPQKSGAIERYSEAMLRREWDLNGETIIRDTHDKTLSGRNRAKALLKAEKKRKANPAYYAETYGLRGPVKIPVIMVRGIKSKCYRSIDGGEKRTGGDLFYVAKVFDRFKMEDKSQEFKDGQKKTLARMLATAARTVWLRLGGKDVADAPKLPPSALDEFVKKHPQLVDCVVQVYREDEGSGGEKLVSSYVSPAYLAAVMYLMATAKTDREYYDESGTEAIDTSLMPEGELFVSQFASGEHLEAGSPVLVLRKLFAGQRASQVTRDRDVILNMLVKAAVLFLDDRKDVKNSDVNWKPADESVPRLGGMDTEPEVPEVPEEAAEETADEAPAKPKKKAKKKAPKAEEAAAE